MKRIKLFGITMVFSSILLLALAIGMNVLAYRFNLGYKGIIILFNLSFLGMKGLKIKIEKHHIYQLLFIGWCTIYVIFAKYEVDINIIPTLCYCLTTAIVLRQVLINNERIEQMMISIIISSYILAVIMVAHFGLTVMLTERINNEVINTNRAGTIFAVSLFFCLYIYYSKHKKVYIILMIPLLFFALVSGSKSALVITMMSCSVLIIFKDGYNSSKILRNLLIVAAMCFAVIVLITKIGFLYSVIGARFQEFVKVMIGKQEVLIGEHSIYMRITMMQYGIKGILQNPILGHGLNSFKFLGPWLGRYSHSNYIELWFNMGVVGLFLFYEPYFRLIKTIQTNRKNMDKLIWGFLSAFSFYYLVWGIMGVFYNELFEWVVLEMMIGIANNKKEIFG